MSDLELLSALEPVAVTLRRLGVGFHVGGSLASSAYGIARTALDVDLAADLLPDHTPELTRHLGPDYYLDPRHVRRAVRNRRVFRLVHLATLLKIDVFVTRGRPFDREVRRRVWEPSEEGETPPFPLATAEDVVLLKLEWFRDGGEVGSCHWRDVVGVLRVQRGRLDRGHLKRWAGELGLRDLLRRAEAEAAILDVGRVTSSASAPGSPSPLRR